ncbi:transposase, partial [Thermopetrobacter sp. TC1]|uniref:transposase n=1 Tax=Thermopetrobacter sp. TC1 TaxID=1495045 RepID=UPI0018CF0EF8
MSDHRQHHRAGASACCRRKRGAQDQAIGRSRGGLSCKIHVLVDGFGNPLLFILTAGQVADIAQAIDLLKGLSLSKVLADKAYDSNELRAFIAGAGGETVIPSKRSRTVTIPHDREIYKERHLVECFI